MNNIIIKSLNNCFFKDDVINKSRPKDKCFTNNKYKEIPLSKKKNRIQLIYKLIDNKIRIRIFGFKFVENNKHKCYLVYKGKKKTLMEYLLDEYNTNNKIKIEFIIIANIRNLEEMFLNCNSLIMIKGFSNLNTNRITNIRRLFYNCFCLESLSDISQWNIINVTNMNGLFYECTSLKSMPDISKWNTNNVTDMSQLFYNCFNLESLSDISKWNMNNVVDISQLFYGCSSLKYFPDISK